MNISRMDSAGARTLFSGFNTGSSSNIYSSLSDYSSIKTGSYGKLLSSYYNMESGGVTPKNDNVRARDNTSRGYELRYQAEQAAKANKTQSNADTSSVVSNTSASKSNSTVASAANDMVSIIDDLNKQDTFKTTGGSYNTDDIYKRVASFVDSYNKVIEGSKNSTVSGVTSNVSQMTNNTQAFSKSLSNIGITIGSDKKLTLNENTFKNADMSAVKETFGRSNFGYSVRSNAYMAGYYATNAQSQAGTYGPKGNFDLSDLMSSYQGQV